VDHYSTGGVDHFSVAVDNTVQHCPIGNLIIPRAIISREIDEVIGAEIHQG
jgi:hypothetical protein